jgi:murein DD-endopeptidase MepM/ murein hydrolase activator NlpD
MAIGRTIPSSVISHVQPRAICAALVAFLLFPPIAATGAIKDRIMQKQAQLHQTRLELHERKAVLSQAQLRTQDLQRQIEETNRSIAAAGMRVASLDADVRRSQKRLAWNSLQLNAAKATLERHNNALRRRLVDAYEHGELGYLNVLFASTSFNDFVERWDDIRFLITANQRTVYERKEAEERVSAAQRVLEGNELNLENAVARQREAQYQLASLAQTRTGLLIAAEKQRRTVATEVTRLEEISAQEESVLESLIVERQRQEAVRREAERRAALLAGKEAPTTPSSARGFNWPAAGPITSPFGYRSDPYADSGSSEFHTGLDIGAPMGSTVTATAAGTVIYAAWYGGYGNAIIIDHGNGVSSLYGHLSQIFVSDHQEIQQSQAIGAVGSTGRSTGPHLHFEIRINGQPVDPASRLR